MLWERPVHCFPFSRPSRETFQRVIPVQLVFPGMRQCRAAHIELNQNTTNYSLAGRACYYGGDPTAASSHFRAATQLDDAALPAWEGVALTQVAAGDYLGAAKTYEELVRRVGRRKRERERRKGRKKGARERH